MSEDYNTQKEHIDLLNKDREEQARTIDRLTSALAADNEREEKMRDVLIRRGFVECDIAACNCGSWHHRYGLPERMDEIKEALSEAGVLDNSTGNLPINAIKKLIGQRDRALNSTPEPPATGAKA